MTRTKVLVLIVLVAAVSAAASGQQRLILKDGRKIDGRVEKTKDGFQVTRPNGLVVVFPTDQALRVEDVVTPAQEFKKRFAKAGKSPEKLYDVAVWARENKLLMESRLALKKSLEAKPDYEDARLMLKLVEAEIKALATKPPPSNGGTTTTTPTTPTVTLDPSKLLKTEDVYRIRLLELSSRENVGIEYRKDVLKRFMEARLGPQFRKAGGEREFLRWPRVRQVRYILNETDRRSGDYRDDILIKADPLVLKAYRAQIWPIIQSGCASQHCHGGAKGAGKLKLFTAPMSDDRVVYTNFYILHEWQRSGHKIINLDAPENSLLLEYGLPPDVAKPGLVHPKNRTPPFLTRREDDYRKVKLWIEKLRNPMLPPGYRVDYKIPLLDAGKTPVDPKAIPAPPKPDVIPGAND